jgi:uncharacterized phage protein (TIGR02218 family)
MPPSAGMIAHLQLNVTYLCELWKIEARDGTVAAYCNHTRNITYNSVTYKATPSEPTRSTRKLGLGGDGAELSGVFDSTITEADVYSGRWRDARIQKETVCYKDLTLGSVDVCRGFAGKFQINNGTFVVEFRPLSSRLEQIIGALTSPIDRTRRADETGVSMVAHTHATTVSSVTSRKVFKVPYVQPSPNYFRYGIALFTSGANINQEMEIKSSTTTDAGTRTEIELHKSVRSDIVAAVGVTLKRGYDGTRTAAKALGAAAVLNFDGEPDMPLPDDILRYQP